jgi:hypothetical protein
MSPRRRTGAILVLIAAVAGATVGYLSDGIGMAVAEGVLIVLGGTLGLRLAPDPAPAPPESIPRPALGSSRGASRRRHEQAFAIAFGGLPLVGGAALIAILADNPTARVVGAVAAVVTAVWVGGGLVATSAPGARWDLRRRRSYETNVSRAARERALWEQRHDPVRERVKQQRLVGLLLIALLFPLGLALALVPAFAAALSDSAAIKAIALLLSLGALTAVLRWAWRLGPRLLPGLRSSASD